MTQNNESAGFPFTDKDRLRLLQLLTRRAVAERPADRAEPSDPQTNHGAPGSSAGDVPGIPPRWRLIPDGVSLYAWQQECLPLWLRNGHGTVKVATGGGKTLFALAAAERLQNESEPDLRLVVVVPTIPLMFQWQEEIRRGNIPDTAIGLMGGGQEPATMSGLRILICVLNSARDRLPTLVAREAWAPRMLLVVDECHRSNAEQARRIFQAKPRYTLGLSATPEQDRELEGLPTDEAYSASAVGQALGPILYDFSIRQSLAAGLLTPFEVWHLGLELNPAEANEHARLSREITELRKGLQARHRRSKTSQGFLAWCQTQASRGGAAAVEATRFVALANRRKRLLYRATARLEVCLAILAESAADLDARTIVFHETIAEIEHLFLGATARGLPVVLEHSKLPESLRAESIGAFRKGIARAIISAKSLIEGFNVPSADLGVIAASSSSVRQRIQSLGRMLRRKPDGRGARIIVLYIRDTEDEAVYEKADWEAVIGTERNRYFRWHPQTEEQTWSEGLEEVSEPPRQYRPPSWEVDVSGLRLGDAYPGQDTGDELKVDQAGNLRAADDTLVPAPRALVEAVLASSAHRRARATPAGHLIVRADSGGPGRGEWKFLGLLRVPQTNDGRPRLQLRLRTMSGRRRIALEDDRHKGVVRFALGPGESADPQSGQARDLLLDWIRAVEEARHVKVREIFWDRASAYWLEIEGETIAHEQALAPLEFHR